jgi:hypothetical protein
MPRWPTLAQPGSSWGARLFSALLPSTTRAAAGSGTTRRKRVRKRRRTEASVGAGRVLVNVLHRLQERCVNDAGERLHREGLLLEVRVKLVFRLTSDLFVIVSTPRDHGNFRADAPQLLEAARGAPSASSPGDGHVEQHDGDLVDDLPGPPDAANGLHPQPSYCGRVHREPM